MIYKHHQALSVGSQIKCKLSCVSRCASYATADDPIIWQTADIVETSSTCSASQQLHNFTC